MSSERIAKIIARSGLCSRRDAERWIESGRVAVNGKIVNSPALNVSEKDEVQVDGTPLPHKERLRLWLMHKPTGVITSHKDPEKRKTVFDILPPSLPRVISVGRLDLNSEGLLLLTNSGELARYLEHPSKEWSRTYHVRVYGKVNANSLEKLSNGVSLKDPKTDKNVKYGPIEAKIDKEGQGKNTWLEFRLKEGKNREIRNIYNHLGLQVNRLIRTSYGPFQLGNLAVEAVEELPYKVIEEKLGQFIQGM